MADAVENEYIVNLLGDAVRSFPPQPVEVLLSNGVCAGCVSRLFGVLIDKNRSENDEDVSVSEKTHGSKEEIDFCVLCLGILQFVYYDDRGILTKKDHASGLAAEVAEVVKKEGHRFDSFSLEVSVPQVVALNEEAVWLFMKQKFGSEPWFSEKFPSESIATKDYLKISLTSTLEKLLGAKCKSSDFRILLTYTLPDSLSQGHKLNERHEWTKRRKIGDSEILKKDCGTHKIEGRELTTNSVNVLKDNGTDIVAFPLEKAKKCCMLKLHGNRISIYIGGRYLKYSRNVSQSRWIIDDERMGEASIEEIVGGIILPMCQGDSYKFHAAGREDIDVRMLGTGRPFLVEIQNSRQVPSEVSLKNMETKINRLERKLVRVKNLRVLGSQGWELMRAGEAEKQKEYAALVWIPRSITNDDVLLISSFKDMKVVQKTPIRVLHRRSPLERKKIIHWMKVEKVAGSSQYFLLYLCTQAGTYIKEFVHGDLGRTHPSVGSILGCKAEILQLDVTDVKMDCF